MQNIRGDAFVDLLVSELRLASSALLPFKAISSRFEQFALQQTSALSRFYSLMSQEWQLV